MSKGQVFYITGYETPSTGFSWVYKIVADDSSKLLFVSKQWVRFTDDPNKLGSGGLATLTF